MPDVITERPDVQQPPVPALAIYDPRRLSEPAFLAGFVARGDVVEKLLDKLRNTKTADIGPHVNIVGQRGMGKTSLLRRLAIGIATDAQLTARFLPLTFREEQYNVRSLDRFWRNCGEALAEWAEQNGRPDIATRLDLSLTSDKWRDRDHAAAEFKGEIAALGRRAVLLVDNFDLVLDALSEEEKRSLRKALEEPMAPLLYGASLKFLSQKPADVILQKLFETVQLEPLTLSELIVCMQRLATARGPAGRIVAQIVDKEPERLKTIHIMTGGNPRILALLYQLLERAETQTVFDDLEALLDQLTPFYKARVEDYSSDLQRSIIDAVALNWDPITPRRISEETGIATTTIPAQLKRLAADGILQEVRTSKDRAAYQVAERFLNIWYLMRHGTRRTRHRMRWLAAFLQSFYAVEELRSMKSSTLASAEAAPVHPLYFEALDEAIEHEAHQRIREIVNEMTAKRPNGKLKPLPAETEALQLTHDAPSSSASWMILGITRIARNAFEEARDAFQQALKLDSANPGSHYLFALASEHLKDFASADEHYGEAVQLAPENPAFLESHGNLLWSKLKRRAEAKSLLERAVKHEPHRDRAWFGLGSILSDEGNDREAVEALRKAAKLNPKSAPVFARLAVSLFDTGEWQSALESVRQAVKLQPIPEGWAALSFIQRCVGDLEGAESSARKAIELQPGFSAHWATLLDALLEKSPNLSLQSFFDEARANGAEGGALLRRGAIHLIDIGDLFGARALLDRAIQIEPEEPANWTTLGNLLADQLEDLAAAEATYRTAAEKLPDGHLIPANLTWLLVRRGELAEAQQLRSQLKLHNVGYQLIDAAIALVAHDFDVAKTKLETALRLNLDVSGTSYFEDLLRLLRIAREIGEGERVLQWLAECGYFERERPVVEAFIASIRGAEHLLDVNPETREPAEKIYKWLMGLPR
jgi:Tfp pilus assembly protein PilF